MEINDINFSFNEFEIQFLMIEVIGAWIMLVCGPQVIISRHAATVTINVGRLCLLFVMGYENPQCNVLSPRHFGTRLSRHGPVYVGM